MATSKTAHFQLYNLIYSITNLDFIQCFHKYFTFLIHIKKKGFRRTANYSDIIRHIMVNLANCTENLFYSPAIHIIHTDFPKNVDKLCTSLLVHFKGKSSYTPTYPHYPQFFSVYHHLSPYGTLQFYFCVYLINLHISTKNTRISLDKTKGP